VVNKADAMSKTTMDQLKAAYPTVQFVSTYESETIMQLKSKMMEALTDSPKEKTILGDLLPKGGTVLLVVPIDSEAPKGRIILPQVQVIRDALDHGIQCIVVRDTELELALATHPKVDLVVTDSQAFKMVDAIVPKQIPLTSFSILFARHKGDIDVFLRGADAIHRLKGGERILVLESCTHNHSHEDIGRVKIPAGLDQFVGSKLDYTFMMGNDLPEDLSHYDLVIHCGGCMLNAKTMVTRMKQCEKLGIPITNYGVLLAAFNGILNRATAML
jgi:[FeFe] hydrogenase H-cluster maturation GTPase HydF